MTVIIIKQIVLRVSTWHQAFYKCYLTESSQQPCKADSDGANCMGLLRKWRELRLPIYLPIYLPTCLPAYWSLTKNIELADGRVQIQTQVCLLPKCGFFHPTTLKKRLFLRGKSRETSQGKWCKMVVKSAQDLKRLRKMSRKMSYCESTTASNSHFYFSASRQKRFQDN